MTQNSKNYFNLEKRTLEFSKSIISRCRELPKDYINIELITQLVRSAGSVGANYREANEIKNIFSSILQKVEV